MIEIEDYPKSTLESELQKNPGFRHIKKVWLVTETSTETTYRVRYKEMCMGISSEDMEDITISKS